MGATVVSVNKARCGIPAAHVVVRKNFVGVVAETQYAAMLAARQLTVQWKNGPELPAQDTFFEHLQKQPSNDTLSIDSGDIDPPLGGTEGDSARRGIPILIRCTVRWELRAPWPMLKADRATVWSATQSAYPTRSIVAKLLNLPLENVRVIYVRGSGCYGLNGADAVSFDAAILSQAVGRPVRLQFSREDEMMWENLGAACVIEHRGVAGTRWTHCCLGSRELGSFAGKSARV